VVESAVEDIMRGGKSLLVLLVVALGLGAYIYFVESKRDVDDTAKKDKVFAVQAGSIDEITIHSASGQETTLKKTGDDWAVTAPVQAPADQSAVSSIASTIETLDVQNALEDNPPSVAQYGLDPVRFSVTFKTRGDSTPHRLDVGNKTPTGSDLYARVGGQPRLFLISGYLEDTLNRTTFDLRDKTALKFDRDQVTTITLEHAGSPAVTLTKSGADWRLSAPIQTAADLDSVNTLLSRLSGEQMKSIVAGDSGEPSAAELRKYGLDKPQATVTLGAGSTRASLALGAKTDAGTLYARDLSRPLVFTVDSTLATDLDKKPQDLRVKDIFAFRSYSALGIDVTRAGTTYSFAKSTGKPAEGQTTATDVWKETKPEAKDVNTTGFTDFLNSISSLRASSFVDQPLAKGEDVVIAARSGDAAKPVTERVTLRKSGDTVQAIVDGQSGAAVVSTADFDKAMTQFKELTGTK
jgi:hypothetical protein